MTAAVHYLPGAAPSPAGPDLHLSDDEVEAAAGGYKRAADQLRELHARGFARAYIPKVGRRRVLLERDHYDAVVRGQFGRPDAAAAQQTPAPARGNVARLMRRMGEKGQK